MSFSNNQKTSAVRRQNSGGVKVCLDLWHEQRHWPRADNRFSGGSRNSNR